MIAISFVVAGTLVAADLGRAVGSVTIDGKPIVLQYAYAIDHQKNQLSNKSNETKVILTDKPIPDGTKLADVDYNFPDGIYGVVVCMTPQDNVSHVVVQHPAGTYDAGYFEGVQDYRFKRAKGDRGTINGTLSSKKITTNTMAFFFDAEFAANIQ
ncbi:MAG TPA: hypothetical protein VJZ76_16230 [Thermoanaerobaculia bacterium]|nr:hypothetical protein [Thermoanaerobaculia bacterium]